MTTATFRFYARLNAFLPAERRGRALTCDCPGDATTKHMIEALGVPHTEVALLLVNGESAGFQRRLAEGDRVAVYPKFETLDVSELTRVDPLPPGVPRFVADAHLGALARLLRMAGFDTRYDNAFADAPMAELANREGRILLTRDRELLKHRIVSHGCYLHAVKPAAQLQELDERLALRACARPFSLCLNCNAALRPVDKAQVLDRLPPRVRERHTRFLTCDRCGKLYWEGSHWQDMRALLVCLGIADG
jgi:hypothetical protein